MEYERKKNDNFFFLLSRIRVHFRLWYVLRIMCTLAKLYTSLPGALITGERGIIRLCPDYTQSVEVKLSSTMQHKKKIIIAAAAAFFFFLFLFFFYSNKN